MIKVDRRGVVPPPSLARKATSGNHAGQTEEEAIVAEYDKFLNTVPRPEKFDFEFRAYKNGDVKLALHQLFHGKCAYCESRYAGTQPMDVEHWRPKGGVEEIGPDGKKKLIDGYPWLAARWINLLPSCIDCNRPRIQHDAVTGEDTTLGKANQFPVAGVRMKAPTPGELTPPVEDVPLIIDPTVDDPADHLDFRDDGTVIPRGRKGEQSIRVYALNRAELAFERLGLARLVEQRLTTIEALAAIVADEQLDDDLRHDLQDLVAHEIDALLELADPGKPFSALARQLIQEGSPMELSPAPAPPPWSQGVADILQRFSDDNTRLDHHIVASRLVGLGFEPHLPPTASYLRWTVTGTVRSVSLYQESAGLVSDKKSQRQFAKGFKGADVGPGAKVRFTYQASKLDAVLVATTRFRDWADGRDA